MNIQQLVESKSFCILPFVRQTLWYDGSYKLCCYAGGSTIEQANTSQESFNTPELKQIRNSFLRQEFPTQCQGCKTLTDNGLVSPAYNENQGWFADPVKQQAAIDVIDQALLGQDLLPQMLDIRYSNVCNLKCRTCNPYNSSAIQAENNNMQLTSEKKFPIHPTKQKYNHAFPKTDDRLFRLYFAGGEPLIEQYNLDFLAHWTTVDTPIIINTNLTVLSNTVLELFKKFNNITLNVSIDAYGKLNDYIRHGSNFNTIINNLNSVTQLPNITVTFNTVLNNYNVFDISTLAKFFNDHYNHIPWSIQPVCDEQELFLECLPYELRQDAIDTLEQTLELVPDNSNIINDSITVLKSNVLDRINFNNFIKYAKLLDTRRGECLIDLVPQYKSYYLT
jgi:sulfatase maturation enzyme AslB (radical SAM superfamily)